MEFKFGRGEVAEIIERYYKKYEDFDGKVTIGCEIGSVGYGKNEHDDSIVTIKITGKLNISGIEVPGTKVISDYELDNIFKTVFGNQGHTVDFVTLDSGINESYEGYGMAERIVRKPYFKGVVVSTNEKKFVK